MCCSWRTGRWEGPSPRGRGPSGLGARLLVDGAFARAWTFGVEAGLDLALGGGTGRWSPFAGAGLGARFVLTDVSWIQSTMPGRVALTPAGALGVHAGARHRIGPTTHLYGVIELVAMHPLVAGLRSPERDAAQGWSVRASFGVLFDY